MRPPHTKAEEDLFTTTFFKSADEYLANREQEWKKSENDFLEKARVQKYINWTLAVSCFCMMLLCGTGVRTWMRIDDNLSMFLHDEKAKNERLMQLEEERSIREREKAKRDSVANAAYIKQMNHYESLPDYKPTK